MKYSYVKYCMMRWDMIQDGWIKVEVLSIVIEWSLVDNLVTSENKGNSAEIVKKKKSHNLRHIIHYLTLVKKCLRFQDIIIWGCYILWYTLSNTSYTYVLTILNNHYFCYSQLLSSFLFSVIYFYNNFFPFRNQTRLSPQIALSYAIQVISTNFYIHFITQS
jgi:hypothetical protein